MKNKLILGILFLLLPWFVCLSQNLSNIREVLKYVETTNDSTLIGDNGKALGILQIRKECVMDINRVYKTNYKHSDALIISKSEEMFNLYISYGIRLYQKKYGRLPSEQDIVRM